MEVKTIFIYSDESGTFDYIHNDYFVFSGLICFGEEEKNIVTRKFIHAENCIRGERKGELKACFLSNSKKGKLYRSLNNVYKFSVVIKQKSVNRKIYSHKKHKQRYLDYAYKIVIKKCFEVLINKKYIISRKIEFIFVNADEHNTATDGLYELKESLLNEFKNGTFNGTHDFYYPPIFPSIRDVVVTFCNSKNVHLIRAADIIANHCYHVANQNKGDLFEERNMFVYYLPGNYIGNQGLEYFQEQK